MNGIYKIINKITKIYYIGSSYNVFKRWTGHKWRLNKNKHPNQKLQNSWNKHGESNFDFEVIEVVDRDLLLTTEQKYLDIAAKDKNNCFNISFVAGSPMKGRKHSEETKAKYKLRVYSEHTRKIMGDRRRGRKHSSESIAKMKLAQIGDNHPLYNHRKYNFYNIQTNQTFSGTQYEFQKQHNLNRSSVSALLKKRMKTLYGWRVSENTSD